MPTHVYTPKDPEHVTKLDRLYVHPAEMAGAVGAALFGGAVLVSLYYPHFVPSPSLERMPWAITLVVGIFQVAGGVLAFRGLNWADDTNVAKGWDLEKLGWWLTIVGYTSYALTVSWYFRESLFAWGVFLFLAAAAALRVRVLHLIKREARRCKPNRQGGNI